MNSVSDFYDAVSTIRIPKQTIEEYAKSILELNDPLDYSRLKAWKDELMALLMSKSDDLTIICEMNLLFILNKVIAELAPERCSELFHDIINLLLEYAFRASHETRELQHILKLIKTWIGLGKFEKEFLLQWRQFLEAEIQKCEAIPSSSSQLPSSTDPAAKSQQPANRKRTRSSDSKTLESILEFLSTPTMMAIKKEIEEIPPPPPRDATSQDFLQRMIVVMGKFIKQFFDHLCSMSQSTQEIHHWKTIMCTSIWLLHNYSDSMDLSVDDVALSFACMYLAGKAEHFFIKTDKLRTIGQKFLGDCFGKDTCLPSDANIFVYEMKLLQMICFNVNTIQNPYKQLKIWKDERKIDENSVGRYIEIIEQEGILYQSAFWCYHAHSFMMFIMFLKEGKISQIDRLRENLKRLFKAPVYIEVKPHTKEMIELFQLAQHYDLQPIADKTVYYNTLQDLVEKITRLKLPLLPALQTLHCPPTDRSDTSGGSLPIPPSSSSINKNLSPSATSPYLGSHTPLNTSTLTTTENNHATSGSTPIPSAANLEIFSDEMTALEQYKSHSPSVASNATNTPWNSSTKALPKDDNEEEEEEEGEVREEQRTRELTPATTAGLMIAQPDSSTVSRVAEGIAFAQLNSPTNDSNSNKSDNNSGNNIVSRKNTITSLTDQLVQNSLEEEDEIPPPPPPPQEEVDPVDPNDVSPVANPAANTTTNTATSHNKSSGNQRSTGSQPSSHPTGPSRVSSREKTVIDDLSNLKFLRRIKSPNNNLSVDPSILAKRKVEETPEVVSNHDNNNRSNHNNSSSNNHHQSSEDTASEKLVKKLRTD